MRWGGLGDVALCSALFEDIHRHYPDAELHLNVEPPWCQLFENDPRFEKLFVQRVRKVARLESASTWLRMLREERYDLVIDLQSNDRSRLYLTLAVFLGIAPKYRVGMKSSFPYNLPCGYVDPFIYAFNCYQAPLEGLGVGLKSDRPVFYLPTQASDEAKEILERNCLVQKDYVVLVPGSSAAGKDKRWGTENYIQLGKKLLDGGVEKIVIVGSGDEQNVCSAVTEGIGDKAINLCNQTSLCVIPLLADAAKAIISNDTGVAHVAAAASTPIWVICGPTRAERVKPLGNHVRWFQIDPECFVDHFSEQCMAKLAPEEVACTVLAELN